MDMQIFAKRLRDMREERNVSAVELAEALGINATTIYRYETAAFKGVKSVTLNAIAEYLRVNPDYLTGVSDNKRTEQEVEDLVADITDAEKTVLELFRKLTAEDQTMALDVLRAVLKRDQ